MGIGMPISQSRMPRMMSLQGVDAPAKRGADAAAHGDHRFVSAAARRWVALALMALLMAAGCETDPVGRHLWGFGDPVRGAALRGGNRDLAVRILDAPAFTAGPLVTLARLEAMPRLPRTAAAANLVANEINRLDNRRV